METYLEGATWANTCPYFGCDVVITGSTAPEVYRMMVEHKESVHGRGDVHDWLCERCGREDECGCESWAELEGIGDE